MSLFIVESLRLFIVFFKPLPSDIHESVAADKQKMIQHLLVDNA